MSEALKSREEQVGAGADAGAGEEGEGKARTFKSEPEPTPLSSFELQWVPRCLEVPAPKLQEPQKLAEPDAHDDLGTLPRPECETDDQAEAGDVDATTFQHGWYR